MGLPEKIETRLFINGEFAESSNGKTFDIHNPATLKLVAKAVHEASEEDTDRAVAAAKAAFPSWSALSPDQRAPYFKKLAALIREANDELGALEAASMGKPLGAFFDAYACASKWEHYSEVGYSVQGTTSVQTPGFINLTLRQPYGVVAAIIPWNVPLLFLASKLAPALIVGNTVVLKSSEKAPLTSAKLATLVQKAGFPPGVINIITGFGNVSGSILSHHMDVRALSFTGSGRTGRLIQAAAAKSNLKQVFLELGGKSPAVVFEDADLEAAVKETAYSIQWNSGQVCMANSRVYVQDTIAQKYIDLFKDQWKNVAIGDPLEKGTSHGPQADEVQHKTVLRYLEMGKQSGELLIGGSAPSDREGYYIQPTIFTNTPEDAQIMKEEVFGPVVNINVFKTEEEVLKKANDTEYGLYAAVYTKNIDRALRFAKGLEAGTIGVNCTSPTTGRDMPFGGYKSSGTGREGEPNYSLNNFLEIKTVCIKISTTATTPSATATATASEQMPGPCRYCARTGATCRIATPRRKRPYYHVTEEEYQCSMRILEHFFPDQELNLHNLRTIAKGIVNGTITGSVTQQTPPSHDQGSSGEEDDVPDAEAEAVVESVNDLHEPLGCLMRDSQGRFRYIGAHSEIPFNAAVCSIGDDSRKGSSIINPPKIGSYPPAMPTPSSSTGDSPLGEQFYLPSRETCDIYISKFLEHVHCTHWLYSIESFLGRVDQTYSSIVTENTCTSSWLCSLYAIFAIGSVTSGADEQDASSYGGLLSDEKSALDYVTMAKQLIPAVYDEADLDSIRALAIMSIVLENLCSRVSSYLYMGASIQMAYSLGLHRDQVPDESSTLEREQYRRLWWSLFILEQEVASRGGAPTLVDERMLKIATPLPSEQMLYPGMHTPLSWISTSVSLCRLKRDIIQTVYAERSNTSRTISFSTISNLLLSLQKWMQQIPPHLKHDVPVPPTHKRAVAVLHLQYWGSTILLCRPFLLHLVLSYATLGSSKKIWFERMGKTCIDAAQKSLAILQLMAADNNLSSFTAFDSTCILRIVMIFILAFGHTKLQHYRSNIEAALHLLKGMPQVGFCKMVTEETPMRLADLGLTFDNQPNTGVLLDDDLIAQLWGNLDPNFMTPLQTQQSLDLTFEDSGSFDLNSDMLQFTSLDDSIPIDPSQAYHGFGFQ
ncbi:aldehyde dehydrogenase-like protein [Aaosphaeria arxii CBS 175.79]|uniref:aldehyde dehydrogenase (NAD(+)) n=1 Tax=Aaosphaeria arxii CBS 175.79 TaxID=1450172 RepID=A0A6A5XSV1_9PLEO|nr:aldehyde dehydrogenase-like protein [Aaosphaeria arxii CBS 175.79]KAF2016395.1 aldehyde dehydrogenase-like protein [Aaosphaeria arxii CBS 175.79]